MENKIDTNPYIEVVYKSTVSGKSFHLTDFTFYRNEEGKPEKIDQNNIRYLITEEEFKYTQEKYNYFFNDDLNL